MSNLWNDIANVYIEYIKAEIAKRRIAVAEVASADDDDPLEDILKGQNEDEPDYDDPAWPKDDDYADSDFDDDYEDTE